jgi:hypothetical protein
VGPYGAQWMAWRCPVAACFHNVGDGVAVAGMASRWRGRSHRVDGDGGDCSHWPDVTAPSRAVVEQSCVFPSRALPSFFEGAVRRLHRSGWYSATGWLLTMPHSVAQRRGVGGVVLWRDSQVHHGMDSPLTQAPACVSALNAPARGAGVEVAGP